MLGPGSITFQIWRHIVSEMLLPSHSFVLHTRLAAVVYNGWPSATLGRPPLWFPDTSESCRTNVARFLESIQVHLAPYLCPRCEFDVI